MFHISRGRQVEKVCITMMHYDDDQAEAQDRDAMAMVMSTLMNVHSYCNARRSPMGDTAQVASIR